MMRPWFIFFIVMLSLAELIFSFAYYWLTFRIDEVLMIGFVIYCGCIISVSIQFHREEEKRRRKELLDSLLAG